jgi:ribosomal protein S18 acetylase RimI-like enzyme
LKEEVKEGKRNYQIRLVLSLAVLGLGATLVTLAFLSKYRITRLAFDGNKELLLMGGGGILMAGGAFCTALTVRNFDQRLNAKSARLILQKICQNHKPETTIEDERDFDNIQKILAVAPSKTSKHTFRVERAGDNHRLHALVTRLIQQTASSDEKIKVLWKKFSDKLHHANVEYPDGRSVKLDFTPERELLQAGTMRTFQLRMLSANDEDGFQQIRDIEMESFAGNEIWNEHAFRTEMFMHTEEYASSTVVAATSSGEILGLIGYKHYPRDKRIHLWTVARKANAAGLGVAEAMMKNVLEKHPSCTATLQVRAGNQQAQTLYGKHGFRFSYVNSWGYTCPDEPTQYWTRQPVL